MNDDALRSRYPHWTPVTLRFSDQDGTGHVNNVSFAAYIEAGRVDFGYTHTRPLLAPGQDLFMANVAIAYRRQLHYPGTIDVGTGVLKLGRTSITLRSDVYFEGALIAEGESVVVLVDRASGASQPLSDAVRAMLEKLTVTPA